MPRPHTSRAPAAQLTGRRRVQVVDSVLAINPGYLSRRKGAGTYARMTLHAPRADADAAADAMLIHRVFDRARVEIVRI